MPSPVGLYVAIYSNEGGIYKHWSLYIEGPTTEERTIVHITGSSTRFTFEMKKSNARDSVSLIELIHLYNVDTSKIEPIKTLAQNETVHNESPGYNCQDYILDLLRTLEKEGIVNEEDTTYRRKKKTLKGKQEGLA